MPVPLNRYPDKEPDFNRYPPTHRCPYCSRYYWRFGDSFYEVAANDELFRKALCCGCWLREHAIELPKVGKK